MALSEWDVLALDEQGRSSNGTSETSPAGVTFNPFEGVLQAAGAECWHPLSEFPTPQFGAVRDGDLTVLDTRVLARTLTHAASGTVRGLVWATWFLRGAEVTATVGVTVRGFDALGKYAGVTPADVKLFKEALARWAKEGRLPAALAALGTGNALRFNQGDAFFAKKMGHACSATPPGEAELPMLYHTQRREAIDPHIVRRDADAARLPAVAGAIAPAKRRPNKPARKTGQKSHRKAPVKAAARKAA